MTDTSVVCLSGSSLILRWPWLLLFMLIVIKELIKFINLPNQTNTDINRQIPATSLPFKLIRYLIPPFIHLPQLPLPSPNTMCIFLLLQQCHPSNHPPLSITHQCFIILLSDVSRCGLKVNRCSGTTCNVQPNCLRAYHVSLSCLYICYSLCQWQYPCQFSWLAWPLPSSLVFPVPSDGRTH